VLAYAPKHQLLISGGRKGFTCIIDLRQKQQQQLLQSHDSPVKAIAVGPTEEYFVTGSAEGNIKVLMRGKEGEMKIVMMCKFKRILHRCGVIRYVIHSAFVLNRDFHIY